MRYSHNIPLAQLCFKITCSLYLFSRAISISIFVLYAYALTGKWYRLRNSPKHYVTWFLLTILILAFTSTGILTDKLFSVDSNLVYKKEVLFIPFLVVIGLGFFYAGKLIFAYGKVIDEKKRYHLYSVFIISLAGIIVQNIFPVINIDNLCTSIPLMFIFLVIQKPVENIDDASNCLNYFSFIEELNKIEKLQENLNIILIKIINHKVIEKNFSQAIVNDLLSEISSKIYKLRRSPETEIYYLSSFMFAVTAYTDDEARIKEFARNCSDYLEEKHEIKEETIFTRFKMCIIKYPEDIPTCKELISFTNTFGNCIRKFNCVTRFEEEAKSQEFQITYQLNNIITEAIAGKKFELFYQPIYNVHSQKFESAEALIRLRTEQFDYIRPDIFIPAAEKSGAIHSIGDFVLNDVFKFISENHINDIGLKYIELNLSIAQCIEINLVTKILNLIRKYGISNDQVNLELTESVENYDKKILMKNINALSTAGLAFSLDDFGTGYSNMERVNNLPVEIIKFDKSFADECNNEKMSIVIKELIEMMHKINKKVLIEGIEKEADLKTFIDFGVDYVQGYYFSKPLEKKAFLDFIRDKNGYTNGGEKCQ